MIELKSFFLLFLLTLPITINAALVNIKVVNPVIGDKIHLNISVKNMGDEVIKYNGMTVRVVDKYGNPVYSEDFNFNTIYLSPGKTEYHDVTLNYPLPEGYWIIIVELNYNGKWIMEGGSTVINFKKQATIENIDVIGYSASSVSGLLAGLLLGRRW